MIDIKLVPVYLRIITGVLALANIVYGIIGYFKPSQIFENSTVGIDVKETGAKYAGFEYASRNLAIGIGLLVAALAGTPMAIVIVTIIRALIEIQTVIINIAIGKINEGFVIALVFLAIELFVIITIIA
jgi:hypothetical protein